MGWLNGLFGKKEQKAEKVITVEQAMSSLNSATTLTDWGMGFVAGYNWALENKFQPNFKFIRVLTHAGPEKAAKGMCGIRNYMVTGNSVKNSKIVPLCTLVGDYNLQSVIKECIENAEQHGWHLTDSEIRRMHKAAGNHVTPEVLNFLDTAKQGESISIRIIYRPPMPKHIRQPLPPTLIVQVCGGAATAEGNAPEETSDIIWTSAIFRKMGESSRKAEIEKTRRSDGDDSELAEMK